VQICLSRSSETDLSTKELAELVEFDVDSIGLYTGVQAVSHGRSLGVFYDNKLDEKLLGPGAPSEEGHTGVCFEILGMARCFIRSRLIVRRGSLDRCTGAVLGAVHDFG